MKLTLGTKKPKLARPPRDIDQHIKSLMRDFEAVNLWLQENEDKCSDNPMRRFKKNVNLGVKQGVALGLEDVSQGIRQKVDEKFVKEVVEREITKEFSKDLSIGVRKILFDKLYKSYTKLHTKLAAEGESAGGHNQRLHDHLSPTSSIPNPNIHVSEKAASQDGEQTPWSDDGGAKERRREPSEAPEASLELSKDHNEKSFDRCCVCCTLASEEELITTTCCLRFVGSLCFEESMQGTGKCCLCHESQTLSESPNPNGYSEHDSEYKFHFLEVQNSTEDAENDKADKDVASQLEIGVACSSREESRTSLASGYSAEPVVLLRETSERTARTSEICKHHNKSVQGKEPFPNLSTEPSHKSHENFTYRKGRRLKPLKNGPEDSVITKEYEFVLRLFDPAVISYLKDLSQEDVLATVYEALEKGLPPIVHATIFGVLHLESADVRIKYEIDKRRVPDLEGDAASWAETLEKFVRARLGTYTVIMHNLEIETMDLSDEIQRLRTIEELVGYNASTMQSLSRPDDIRLIHWTMGKRKLHEVKIASITIGLATAAQANEVIARGLLWKGERRYCVKHGPKRKLVQCDRCQAFGHTVGGCSFPPRCQACAEGHQSQECPHGLDASSTSLKCALCGGRHSARDYFCTVKRGEELRLENRFYPTDAENVPAASETTRTKSSPLPASKKSPLLAKLPSNSSNNDLYSQVGNDTPVVEQRPPFAAFDEQIILQQSDGSKYAIPARLI